MADGPIISSSIENASNNIISQINSANTANTTGLNRIAEGIEGLHQIKDTVLKTEVQGLPEEFLKVFNQLSIVVENIRSVNQILGNEEQSLEEQRKTEQIENEPSKENVTENDLLKLPAKIASPPLFLGSKINELVTVGTDILNSLNDLKDSIGPILSNMNTVKDDVKGPGIKTGALIIVAGNIDEEKLKSLDELTNVLKAMEQASTLDSTKLKDLTTGLSELFKSLESLSKNVIPVTAFLLVAPVIATLLGKFILALKKALFKDADGKIPIVGKEQAEAAKDIALFAESVSKIFVALKTAIFAVLAAGALAIPATVFALLMIPFILAVILIANIIAFFNPAAVKIASESAAAIGIIFKSLMWSTIYAIAAGALAIPATVFTMLLIPFVLISLLLAALLGWPKIAPLAKMGSETAKNLAILYKAITFAAIFAIAAGVLAIPAALGALLSVLFIIACIPMFFGLLLLSKFPTPLFVRTMGDMAHVFLRLLIAAALAAVASIVIPIALQGLLGIALFLLGVMVLGTIAFLLKIPLKFFADIAIQIAVAVILMTISLILIQRHFDPKLLLPILIGVITMALILVAFAILGFLAKMAVFPVLALTLVSLLIFIAVIFLRLALKETLKLMDFIMGDFLAGVETPEWLSGVPQPFGAFIAVALALLPIALVILAFAIIGFIALIAVLPMLGLLLFGLLALVAIPLLVNVIKSIAETMKQVSAVLGENSEGGIGGLLGALSDDLKPLGGVINILGSLIGLIIIIALVAVLGLVATIAWPLMLGLKKFAEAVPIAMGMLAQAMRDIVSGVDAVWAALGEGQSALGTFLGLINPNLKPIGNMISLLGRLIGLIIIIALIAVLGIVATVAWPFMNGLKKFAEAVPAAMDSLAAAMPAISRALAAVGVFLDDQAPSSGLLGLIGKIAPGMSGALNAMGKIMSLIFIIAALGALGLVALAAERPIMSLVRTSAAIEESMTALANALPSLQRVINMTSNMLAEANTGGGGARQFFRGLWQGQDTAAAEAKIMAIGTVFKALGKVGEEAQKQNNFITGLVRGASSLKTASDALLAAMIKVQELTNRADAISEFSLNFRTNIIKPMTELDPAINRLNQLNRRLGETASELDKLNRRSNVLTTLSNLGRNADSVLKLVNTVSNMGGAAGPGAQGSESSEILKDIRTDVGEILKGLAVKPQSWTAPPSRSS